MNIGLFCMILVLIIALVDYFLKNAKQLDEYVTGTISGKYIKTTTITPSDDGGTPYYKDIYYLMVQYKVSIDPNISGIGKLVDDLTKVVSSSTTGGDQSGIKRIKEIIVSKEIYDKANILDTLPIAIDKRLRLF